MLVLLVIFASGNFQSPTGELFKNTVLQNPLLTSSVIVWDRPGAKIQTLVVLDTLTN